MIFTSLLQYFKLLVSTSGSSVYGSKSSNIRMSVRAKNHCKSVHTPLGERTSLERLSTVLEVYFIGTSANIYQMCVGWKALHRDKDGLPQAQRASSTILWGKDSKCFLTNCSSSNLGMSEGVKQKKSSGGKRTLEAVTPIEHLLHTGYCAQAIWSVLTLTLLEGGRCPLMTQAQRWGVICPKPTTIYSFWSLSFFTFPQKFGWKESKNPLVEVKFSKWRWN